ncbi:iron ABC transporter permease [Desulfopila sp. IMCC35008]|uniref:ABC transporter permease n=1 Tax=Desulfopila sp. IMCC35008 TaxID=2653858 RepID=UPI0013D6EA69|nr:iron ABC transporter permease [Desulfopila sp. IMCC35008]
MKSTIHQHKSKDPWRYVVWVLAAFVVIPIAIIFSSLLTPEKEIWEHLSSTLLPELITNTLILVIGVACFTALIGVSLGWFTGACDFPGRKLFSWSLALPMALPAYVMAFIFLGLMDFSGPVQKLLRTLPGFEGRMIEVRTPLFVILVIGLTLYPYVYLLSRASFMNQGRSIIEASRTLGYTPVRAFFKVALPISRPWIVSGLALVLMETLADFGAVSIFNFNTFTTAIYKSWFGFFSLNAAKQLSSLLVFFALALVMVEGLYRSRMRYFDSSRGGSVHSRLKLTGWKGWSVTAYCTTILIIAFIAPIIQLVVWTLEVLVSGEGANYSSYVINTLILGALAALLICSVSLLLAYARRRDSSGMNRFLCRIATIGYALPGTVLAVGIVVPVVWTDNLLQDVLSALFSIAPGPIIQGTVLVMLVAYLVRFLAVGFGSVDSAMQNIKPSLDEAAAILGKKSRETLIRIHFPLLQKGLLTAMVLSLVDVIKEMPITLMTRPFGWDTLAVKIYELTSEGEWVRAALPGLYLVIAGMIPVFILIRKMEK